MTLFSLHYNREGLDVSIENLKTFKLKQFVGMTEKHEEALTTNDGARMSEWRRLQSFACEEREEKIRQ